MNYDFCPACGNIVPVLYGVVGTHQSEASLEEGIGKECVYSLEVLPNAQIQDEPREISKKFS